MAGMFIYAQICSSHDLLIRPIVNLVAMVCTKKKIDPRKKVRETVLYIISVHTLLQWL